MKCLFYIYSLNKGGAERVLLTLADRFRLEPDMEVVILTDTRDEREYDCPDSLRRIILSEYMAEGPAGGLTALRRLLYRIPRYGRQLALMDVFKKEQPDRIIAFMIPGAVRAIKASRMIRERDSSRSEANIPVVSCVRYDPYEAYGQPKARRKLLSVLKHSYRIVCQTEDQKSFFEGESEEKCRVIFNPISDSFCVEPYKGIRKKMVVSTGRLVDFKRFEDLISAFMRIADKYPGYKLTIYGEGPYRKTLEEHIDELEKTYPDVKSRVFLPGDTSNVADAIKDASVYVLSSLGEGMPNSLMEAMALGLPVVATDCSGGGPASLITDGVNGRLVPVGDIDKMASVIDELLSDEDIRNSLGREAAKLQTVCSLEAITGQWLETVK